MVALDFDPLRQTLRRSLPRTEGIVHLSGLRHNVEVIRDRWGVPHIYAHNTTDLFFGQGFIHAQDRLWQMELARRALSGRLAEIFGPLALKRDRCARTLGFRRVAEVEVELLDDETCAILEAYTRGVNAFLESHRDRLPPEFAILQFQPDPWAIVDCLLWAKGVAWNLAPHWQSKLLRERFVQRLGPEKAAALEPVTLLSSLVDVAAEMSSTEPIGRVLHEYRALFPQTHATLGSNAWAVDGAKSTTGWPFLCNDPHLNPTMPSLWYQNHLVGGEFEVTGVTIPGVPGVAIGHNAHIAWGIAYGCADMQDIYVGQLDGQHPPRYRFRDHWEETRVLRQEITVRGWQEPFIEEIIITRHGPLINNLLEGEYRPLALQWTGLWPGNTMRGTLEVDRAANWSQFTEALRHWTFTSLNVVYADREGNIGHQMTGSVPIRARGHGLLPVPGWTGEYEWEGVIPYDELPRAFNPESHYVASANDKADDDYPYFLTLDWAPGFRIRRITELLEAKEAFSVADFQAMQMDTFWVPGPELVPQLVSLTSHSEEEKCALAYLQQWDFCLTEDSVAAVIFVTLQEELRKLIFGEKLGPLAECYFGSPLDPSIGGWNTFEGLSLLRAQELLQGQGADWLPETMRSPDGARALLHRALRQAIDRLCQRFGPEMEGWKWGRLHEVRFDHPLGQGEAMRSLFSRGPYPARGGLGVICAGALVSYRQILDLEDWDRSVAILPTGQSGHPASPHYDDFIELWRSGRYHPLLWSPGRVKEEGETRLLLVPPDCGHRRASGMIGPLSRDVGRRQGTDTA